MGVLHSHPPDGSPGAGVGGRLLSPGLGFFPRFFGDRAVQDFWCESWLLDPELAAALPAESNISRFQRRWQICGEPKPGDEDALFFTFARRGAVDLDALPRDTTLQRVITDRLRAGGHWQVRQGRIPMAG